MASGQDTNIISLNPAGFSRRMFLQSISRREESAIIDAVNNTDGFLDILSALHKLKNTGFFVSHGMYRHFVKVDAEPKENLIRFIFALLEVKSFSSLTDILHFVGFERLAVKLRNNMNGETCFDIGFAELTNGTYLQRFFYRQKSLLDDNVFYSRKVYLETLFNKIDFEIGNSEERVSQKAVGKLAIVTWLLVQQNEKSKNFKVIINKMTNKLPGWADKTIPDIIFRSKLAVAYELDCDSCAAETYLSEAVSLSDIYHDPLITFFVQHDKRYVYQLRLMRLKNEDNRRKVQTVCTEAINVFSIARRNFCAYIRRIFCLYLIHNLLKVGQNFEVDESEVVSTEEITQSNDIFTCLERCFQTGVPLENRRKMIYFILRARMHEIRGGADFALSYLDQADSIKDDGTYFRVEEEHLTRFKSRLHS
jgi:hypothetical protein